MRNLKLYVARHGETPYNEKNLICGISDVPLNENGRYQADVLASQLKNEEIDIIIASPLKRASKTAEIIIEGKCPIISIPELTERDFGKIEGNPITSEQSKKYWNYELNSHDEEVEPVRHLLHRTREFLIKLLKEHKEQTILIVTHGSTLRALHYNLIGYQTNEDFMKFQVKNCQIFQYKI